MTRTPMKSAILILNLSLFAATLSAGEPQRILTPNPAAGELLVGTWTLVAVDNVKPDGSRVQPYGPHPDGLLVLDAHGRYAVHIFRPGRPHFAAGDKSQGTAEENRAAVQGTNAHFGRYSVDAAAAAITFHIEHALFPNWEGTEQRRSFRLNGDQLQYTVQTPTSGGAETAEVTWKRAG